MAVIVLVLGVASVAAVVRAGDDDGDRGGVARGGPGTSVPATTSPTSTTSTTSAPTTPSTAPGGGAGGAGDEPTTATTEPTTGTPGTTTRPPPTVLGSSGLAEGGAGQVAMGPEIPNTGITSLLGPGAALLGAGVALRLFFFTGRRSDEQ